MNKHDSPQSLNLYYPDLQFENCFIFSLNNPLLDIVGLWLLIVIRFQLYFNTSWVYQHLAALKTLAVYHNTKKKCTFHKVEVLPKTVNPICDSHLTLQHKANFTVHCNVKKMD